MDGSWLNERVGVIDCPGCKGKETVSFTIPGNVKKIDVDSKCLQCGDTITIHYTFEVERMKI